ncbi:MAG: hypothetical protein R3227_14010, partial [Reinekea sp.]|nr:hypothetical protein [Reinekea sp.]
ASNSCKTTCGSSYRRFSKKNQFGTLALVGPEKATLLAIRMDKLKMNWRTIKDAYLHIKQHCG